MHWLAGPPLPLIAAAAISIVLAIVTWRSLTSGQKLQTPESDGQGGRRVYSRFELAVIPLILMGGAGYMFLKGLSPAPAIDLRFLSGLFMIIILGLQVIIILMARGVRQQRRQRREGLFGE